MRIFSAVAVAAFLPAFAIAVSTTSRPCLESLTPTLALATNILVSHIFVSTARPSSAWGVLQYR